MDLDPTAVEEDISEDVVNPDTVNNTNINNTQDLTNDDSEDVMTCKTSSKKEGEEFSRLRAGERQKQHINGEANVVKEQESSQRSSKKVAKCK